MAQVTKRPYEIPKHKYWVVIEDKYLVDYSEDVLKDMKAEHLLSPGDGTQIICSCGRQFHIATEAQQHQWLNQIE